MNKNTPSATETTTVLKIHSKKKKKKFCFNPAFVTLTVCSPVGLVWTELLQYDQECQGNQACSLAHCSGSSQGVTSQATTIAEPWGLNELTGPRIDFGLFLLISNMIIHRNFTGPTHLLSANVRVPVSFAVSAHTADYFATNEFTEYFSVLHLFDIETGSLWAVRHHILRSHEVAKLQDCVLETWIALKYDRQLGSTAADLPVKFQHHWIT